MPLEWTPVRACGPIPEAAWAETGGTRLALQYAVASEFVPSGSLREGDTMQEYTVVWRIYVEAETPEAAAREALGVQRDRESWATRFEVSDERGRELVVDVDDEVHVLRLLAGGVRSRTPAPADGAAPCPDRGDARRNVGGSVVLLRRLSGDDQ